MKTMQRRNALKIISGAIGAGILPGCVGDNSNSNDDGNSGYPEDEITIIVPYSSGGGFDAYARFLAKYLPNHLPNEVDVNVQNMSGSGGIIATEHVYESEPDGYTFQIAHIPSFPLDQTVQDVDYDLQEMTWLPQIADDPTCITVGTNTDIYTWDDFATAVQNEEIQFGVTSVQDASTIATAAIGHIGGEYPAENVFDNLVTYDGSSEIISGVLRGDVQARAGSYESLSEYEESGDLRMIMLATMDDDLPDGVQNSDAVTLASADIDEGEGIAGLSGVSRVFVGPPDIPNDRAEILRNSISDTLTSDELIDDVEEAGRKVDYMNAKDTEAMVDDIFDTMDLYQEILEMAETVEGQ